MSNVWGAGAGANGSGAAASGPGGELPGGFAVAGEVINDILKNFAGYLLAGLGMMVALFPLVLVILVAVYAPIFGSIFAAEAFGEDVAGLLLIGGVSAGMLLAIALSAFTAAPLQASLMRAMWAYQTRGEPLSFSSAFSTFREDYGRVVLAHVAIQGITLVALAFCYFPVFAAVLFLHWVLPGVVIHRRSVGEALSMSFQHAKENLAWTIGVLLVGLLITTVGSYIPVIGPLIVQGLSTAYTLKLYRAAFGTPD